MTNQKHQPIVQNKLTLLAIIVCCTASLFYLYEFFLRVTPSVMTVDLMRALNIKAAGLGTMAAFYFYAYVPMQIPAGLLIDRFGPRKLLSFMIAICALGAIVFGFSHDMFLASSGRFLMGFGSAFAFVGALVLVARWFPPSYFAWAAGITQLLGSVGAIVGQAPLAASVEHLGWRNTIYMAGLIGLGLALITWLIVRDHPPKHRKHPLLSSEINNEFKRLFLVLKKPQTWCVGIYAFCIWAPISIFATLWGIPYLVATYHVSTQVASMLSATIWLGIAIGSPLVGWWSDKIGKRCLPLVVCAALGLISTPIILYSSHLSITALYILLFIFGVAAAGQSLSFASVKENNRPSIVGTAIGFNNMSVIAGAAIFQPVVGILLNLHWDGKYVNQVPVYSVSDYRFALFIIPVCYIIALLVSLKMIKETNCQPQYLISLEQQSNLSEQVDTEVAEPILQR